MLTFGGALWFPVATIMMFGLGGMVMSIGAEHFIPKAERAGVPPGEEEDVPIDETSKTAPKVALGVAGALMSFMLLYWVLNPIKFSSAGIQYTAFFSVFTLPNQSVVEAQASFFFLVFTVPWAEESFFRAFLGNVFLRYFPDGISELSAGSVFALAHSAVYSLIVGMASNWNWPLIGLLTGAGTVFTYVDAETQDVFTSEGGHSIYNGMSVAVSGSVLGFLLPGVSVPFPVQAILMAGVPSAFLFVRLYKKGRGGRSSLRPPFLSSPFGVSSRLTVRALAPVRALVQFKEAASKVFVGGHA
jgi:membrane protease YdiL (CAAX protease family)